MVKAIKTQTKSLLGLLVRCSGMSFFIRELTLNKQNTIICYHNPKPEILRAHLSYIVKRYHVITLDRLAAAIHAQNWSSIPPKSLVITFDDGLRGNRQLLEVIEQFKVPVTIFLCSHIAGTKRQFWFLSGWKECQKLKKVSNRERLEILKEKVGFDQEKEHPQAQALSLGEIKEMSRSVDFQAHTRFHPILTMCEDAESLAEIQESKAALEGMLEKDIRHFAYPNGDYGPREIGHLKKSGYTSGVSMDHGRNTIASDPLCLKRLGICDRASVNELAGELSGIFALLRKGN